MSERTVQLPSLSIAVRDYGGEGSDVLLLHDLERNVVDLEGLASRLSAHHRGART